MLHILVIGFGGFIGAISRYGISLFLQTRLGAGFPWGTLAVNLLGCFLIGLLMELVQGGATLSPRLRLALITGFLGALTTFSTFGYETIQLAAQGRLGAAVGNGAANLLLGLGAVWLGSVLARVWAG